MAVQSVNKTMQVLKYLRKHPYSRNTQIAKGLKFNPDFVSGTTYRLYQAGWLVRERRIGFSEGRYAWYYKVGLK